MATLKIIKSAKPVLAMFAMLVFTGFYTPATAQDQAQDTAQEQAFDLSHAREALQYFAKPSRTNISHVAFSAPARKLAQFYNSNSSDGSEGGSTDKSTFEITQILLNHMPNTNQLDHVKALITMIADNEEKQNQCMANALAHLPQNQIENPLYIVWADGIWANGLLNGKDNIINIANASMLDITNEQYIAQPQDIWTDCIHALHHAGMNKINPIPFSLDGISLSDELLAYIEHTTLLEGSAHYASNPDAVAAITLAKTTEITAKFRRLMTSFTNNSHPLNQDDWLRFKQDFQDSNLGRDMGLIMAQKIDQTLGRDALLRAYSGGSASFFQVFYSIS